jgi:hypothetical protein
MKPVLISSNRVLGFMSLIMIFLVLSTVFWFAAKQLALFDLLSVELNSLTISNYMEYLIIGWSALIISLILFLILKRRQLKNLKLITFSINLAVDGSYHYVQAPAELLSDDFLKLFFSYLKSSSAKGKYSNVLDQYFPMLEIRRNDVVIRIKENETLLGGGLKDGDICQVVGKPKKVT